MAIKHRARRDKKVTFALPAEDSDDMYHPDEHTGSSDEPANPCSVSQEKKEKGDGKSRNAAFQTRCSPARFQKACEKLSHEKKKMVTQMGFGGLLDTDIPTLNRRLCLQLVKSFDLTSHTLCIHGRMYPVSFEDVGLVFGLPDSGDLVPSTISDCDRQKLKEFDNVKTNTLEKIMLDKKVVGERFRRAFLLFALCTLLCPTSRTAVGRLHLAASMVDLKRAKEYNWSRHVFDSLVNEIVTYRRWCSKKNSVGGCTIFLMLIYFHRRPLDPSSMVPQRPLIKCWTRDALHRRITLESKKANGLLHRTDTRFENAAWIYKNLKHEDSKNMLKYYYENVLVPYDEAKFKAETYANVSFNPEPKRDADDEEANAEADNAGDIGGPSSAAKVSTTLSESNKSSLLVKLEKYCTSSKLPADETLVEVHGLFLTRNDLRCLAPRQWVSSFVILFAAKYFMEEERSTSGQITRFLFYALVERVKSDLDAFQQNQQIHEWKCIGDMNVEGELLSGYDILQCKLVFAPAFLDSHWWCYCLCPLKKKLYILDSMGKHKDGSKMACLDELMKIRFQQMMSIMMRSRRKPIELELSQVHLPEQIGCDDCGVYVLKYMQLWDPDSMCEGRQSMPQWSLADITSIRREIVTTWVLNPKNTFRQQVLEKTKLQALSE